MNGQSLIDIVASSGFTNLLWSARVELLSLALVAAFMRWGLQNAKQQVKLVVPAEPNSELEKGLRFIKLNEFYVPNLFASSWMQLAWLMLRWKTQSVLSPTKRQVVLLPHAGGDQIILDYFYPDNNSSGKMAIVVYLPGITGRLGEAIPFVEQVRAKGWIAVVLHRRGHAAALKRPTFNIFGNSLDIRAAVESIAQHEPKLPIALVGSSAGSAAMIRYIGEFSHDSRVVAGVGLSPGYSIAEVWKETTGSFFDRYILNSCKSFFVARNRALLAKKNEGAVIQLESAQSVYDFACAAVAFSADHPDSNENAVDHTLEDWLKQTDPMIHAHTIKIPYLCLNSLDDPICTKKLVETRGIQLTENSSYGALLITDYGTHCAHQTFHKGYQPENWGHIVALDFVEGVISD